MTGAEAVGVGLGFLAIVAPEFWPKMPRALSYTLAGIGLCWLTFSLILGIEAVSDMKLQYGPLGVIIFGAALIALGLFWHISRLGTGEPTSSNHGHAEPLKTTPLAATPMPQTAQVLFEWKWSKLPTIVPASGSVTTMPITSKTEVGASAIFLSVRPGTPGDKLGWGEEYRRYPSVYRGEITNYADFPIFNVAMNFKTEFFRTEKAPDNPNATTVSKVPVETFDRPIVINKIDPRERYSFYVYSDSFMHVHISMPEEITYLRDNVGERETARILPQFERMISLFPAENVEAKSPPADPPQTSSPPSKPRKK